MANVSRDVQIETTTKHDLSLPFQSVAGNESLNVGTLVGSNKGRVMTKKEKAYLAAEQLVRKVLANDLHQSVSDKVMREVATKIAKALP